MMMPFDGSTTAAQQSGQGGLGPQQPLPRPPMGHLGNSMQGVGPSQGNFHHQQTLNAPYGTQRQHSNGMASPSYTMPPQSPSPRGTSLGMPQSTGHHGGPPSSSFMHSPAHLQQRQTPHHHVNMHHSQQQHHSTMHHPGQQSHGHRTHPQQHVGSHSQQGTPSLSTSGQSSGSDRSYVATGLNGNWQSDNDMAQRREMIQHIVKLLKQKDQNATPDWLNKLPQMAKQLEVSLYRSAQSFEAYTDMTTLKRRLQAIAMEVSRKAKDQTHQQPGRRPDHAPNNGMRNSSGGQHPNMMRFDNSPSPYGNPQLSSPTLPGSSQDRQQQMLDPRQQQLAMRRNQQQQGGQRSLSSSDRGRVVHPDEINPMIGGNAALVSSNIGGSNDLRGQSGPNASNNMLGSMGTSSVRSGDRNRPSPSDKKSQDSQVKSKHKQQRLLLLHHSSSCKAEEGRCTVTPHCQEMKRLWRHMGSCTDNQCRVSHCFSSRAILSHYRKCKDANCETCGPVRNSVQRKTHSSSSRPRSDPTYSRGSAPPVPVNSNPMQPSPGMGSLQGTNSFVSSSSGGTDSFTDHQRPSSQTSMPPPVSVSGSGSNMPYRISSDYRASSTGGGPKSSGSVVPPIYKSEQSFSSQDSRLMDQPRAPTSSGSGGSVSGRRGDERQKVRHKQQRLLLLRHASKCQYEGNNCPVTPHCASMKKLWKHIADCRNQHCTVQHCMSSRYVLSHYRRCKDTRCPACGPVRDSIRRTTEGKDTKRQGGAEGDGLDLGNIMWQPLKDDVEPTQSAAKKAKHEPVQSSRNGVNPTKPASGRVDATKPKPSIPTPTPTPITAPAPKPKPTPAKQVEDHSLINSFTLVEIETHIASLNQATQLKQSRLKVLCSEALKALQTHQHGWVFNVPVDPVQLNLPDYFDVIKKPMDLGTIQKKLETGAYRSLEDFQGDVHLTFDNAMTYNEEGTIVHDMGKELKAKATEDYKKLLTQLQNEEKEKRENEKACTLCGNEKLLFEPPVFFCNGLNCPSTRIRRNSHYYVGGNNQYYWCGPCYDGLDDKVDIELVDMTIKKHSLIKKKNDEVHEESWVQCDHCNRWIHQICGLFNTRQNKEHNTQYCCPSCLLESRKKASQSSPMPKPLGAIELPRTKLSEWLERHVRKKVQQRKMELAAEKASSEHMTLDSAMKAVNVGGPVTIRQVTSTDRKLDVRERMKRRYAHKNYPDEFPFRCKCILVFQKLDGVDVILFALYVYEHGADNPAPNTRTVYISYLDSVHFMRPRRMRTFIYHEILISYLDYARQKGFSTAHIWACPPLKGDDYIFYAKPDDQKTPKDSRLRQWYIDMLKDCQKRGIVGRLTNMFDLYFDDDKLDATDVPYLEGDYFPGEAENIIKDIEEGKGRRTNSSGKKSKKKKNGNGKKSKSSGYSDDEEEKEDVEKDPVMLKLGEIIQPMKESFIVAFLTWDGAKPENLVVPSEIEEARRRLAEEVTMASNKKRDADGNVRVVSLESSSGGIDDMEELKDNNGEPIKIIDDDKEELDCEFLNNRQAFLNLCRGNHYQFDQLRRAKHTSMMVLWHLHNRDAPKFVQQCAACSREILTGKRYHCSVCAEFDLCEDCYKNPHTNRGSCTHKLDPIAVETNNSDQNGGGTITEAQRQDRQRNVQLHIQLIEHASQCDAKTCTSSNCKKMKEFLKHSAACKQKASGGCKICKRIWTLLRIHANKCKRSHCSIPQCMAIRERIRQLAKQQQAMDDRRRQEMNRHYRMGMAESR